MIPYRMEHLKLPLFTHMEATKCFILPQNEWEEIKQRISNIEDSLKTKGEQPSNELLTSKEVVRILGISEKTWQKYRKERRIPFSQTGRKIYVQRKDLDEFMNNHKIEERRSI